MVFFPHAGDFFFFFFLFNQITVSAINHWFFLVLNGNFEVSLKAIKAFGELWTLRWSSQVQDVVEQEGGYSVEYGLQAEAILFGNSIAVKENAWM